MIFFFYLGNMLTDIVSTFKCSLSVSVLFFIFIFCGLNIFRCKLLLIKIMCPIRTLQLFDIVKCIKVITFIISLLRYIARTLLRSWVKVNGYGMGMDITLENIVIFSIALFYIMNFYFL